MTLRENFLRSHPDFPLLSLNEPQAIEHLLRRQGLIEEHEAIVGCEKAGEGNMNLTIRVRAAQRGLIVKQARPWVEKFDHIPAPWDRVTFEKRFYERTASIPEVAERMPRLIAADDESRILVLEDLAEARDLTGLYRGEAIGEEAVKTLGRYLRALHSGTRGEPDPDFYNREMRALNHQHLFQVPLAPDNGLELDSHEPGLAAAATQLKADAPYRGAVEQLGQRYLADGSCLVHGDFFPGSWLETAHGIRVIDPEFCFYGDPELDLGVAVAHLYLGRQEVPLLELFLEAAADDAVEPDRRLVAGYAGVEIMRRLIGVAQLPLTPSQGFRAAALGRSRQAVLEGDLGALQ